MIINKSDWLQAFLRHWNLVLICLIHCWHEWTNHSGWIAYFQSQFATRSALDSLRLIVVDNEKNTFDAINFDWSNTIFSHRFVLRGLLLHWAANLKPLKLYSNTTHTFTPFHFLNFNQYQCGMWHVVMTWQPDLSLFWIIITVTVGARKTIKFSEWSSKFMTHRVSICLSV